MKSVSLILFAVCVTFAGILGSAGEVTGAGEVASKEFLQGEFGTKVSEIVSFNVSKNFRNHKEGFVAKGGTY